MNSRSNEQVADTPLSAGSTAEPTLRRSLSLPLITLYGLGTIIGAGIYVLIGKVAGPAGLYAPVAFVLAGTIAGFTALTYAELSARYPLSGAEAVYTDAAFAKRWLTTLAGWSVVIVGVVSSATIANGFVGYLALFVTAPDWLAIGALVLGMGLLAAWGINESVWTAAVITVLEVLGLIMVLAIASPNLSTLPARWPELLPPLETTAWLGIVSGAFLAFYAFIGFEDMVNVAEEVKNPRRNLPLGIVIALVVSSLLYALIALTAVLSVPIDALVNSDAPLTTVIEHSGSSASNIIGLISLVAVLNGALIQIIMAARMLYGLARQTAAPKLFSRIHPLTRTPVIATAWVTLAVLVFALWLPLVSLARVTSAITLVLFALMNGALWRLKQREPRLPGVPSIPGWIPVTGFVLCIVFLFLELGSFVIV